MTGKPTYEELEQRVRELEILVSKRIRSQLDSGFRVISESTRLLKGMDPSIAVFSMTAPPPARIVQAF